VRAAVGWNPNHLPPLLNAWDRAGDLRRLLGARWGLRAGIAVATGAGDNTGSTFGAGATMVGKAVLTIGTSGVSCMSIRPFIRGQTAQS